GCEQAEAHHPVSHPPVEPVPLSGILPQLLSMVGCLSSPSGASSGTACPRRAQYNVRGSRKGKLVGRTARCCSSERSDRFPFRSQDGSTRHLETIAEGGRSCCRDKCNRNGKPLHVAGSVSGGVALGRLCPG